MEGPLKKYIAPTTLRLDAFRLAHKILESGYRPDFMIALWRGGASIGMYCHEFFKWHALSVDHVAIRTSRYTGIGQAKENVQVHSLSYILDRWTPASKILLIDDVWDSGLTVDAVKRSFPKEALIQTAVLYYKPLKNQFPCKPEYYLYETDEWLVFPHELEGMTKQDVARVMGTQVSELLK